jgi:hypothetical protein
MSKDKKKPKTRTRNNRAAEEARVLRDLANIKIPPPPEEGYVNVQFMVEDVSAMSNLFTLSEQTFTTLANMALTQNDQSSYNVFAARAKLSALYADRLLRFLEIGEPDSRKPH